MATTPRLMHMGSTTVAYPLPLFRTLGNNPTKQQLYDLAKDWFEFMTYCGENYLSETYPRLTLDDPLDGVKAEHQMGLTVIREYMAFIEANGYKAASADVPKLMDMVGIAHAVEDLDYRLSIHGKLESVYEELSDYRLRLEGVILENVTDLTNGLYLRLNQTNPPPKEN